MFRTARVVGAGDEKGGLHLWWWSHAPNTANPRASPIAGIHPSATSRLRAGASKDGWS